MLAAAFALKRGYSTAGADALAWVLAPSCWLASHVGGLSLVAEPGAGFIMHHPRMVVGPACAGVNFLVVAWLALFFCGQASFLGARRKLAWLTVSLLAAYVATLTTNGLRIILAAHLFDANIYAGVITKERLHRLLGVVLYCGTLLALCRTAELYVSRTGRARSALTRSAPFLWYVGVVIVVPLANRAWVGDPARFIEHATFTLLTGSAVVLLARSCGRLLDRLHSRRRAVAAAQVSPWPSPRS
jgi:exosortase K